MVDTESCDHYGPYVFLKKQSDDELKKFCVEKFPGEFEVMEDEQGPGDWGSYLYIKQHECEIIK